MPPIPDDPWIVHATERSGFEPERFHALGVVNYRWQHAERSLRAFLADLADIEWYTAWAIIHDMGDIALSHSIRELLNQKQDLSADLKDVTTFALKLYDINRINRNQLTHFTPLAAGSNVTLLRIKGPRHEPQTIPASLQDIRRIADDITTLGAFLGGVGNVLGWEYGKRRAPAKYQGAAPALPSRPPLPEMLWKPPPQN
jgi:hypothetical protein